MRKLWLVALCVLLCGTFAVAQKAELGAGWDYLHFDCNGCNDASVPGGFFIDGTYYFEHAIGLTGDFEYHKKDISDLTGFSGSNARLLSFHGGPRVKGHMGKVEPFAHALFGFTNFNESGAGESFSTNNFSFKLGGGVDYAFSQRLAIRLVEFNYYRTSIPANFGPIGSPNGNDSQNNITIGIGVVIR